jgi:RNA polymerase-binding transcription factor DksA
MSDKHPDILDQAAAITDFMTERAIAQRRAETAPQAHPKFDGKHCVEAECAVEIPAERLAAGRIRCVDCQSILERAQNSFRRG